MNPLEPYLRELYRLAGLLGKEVWYDPSSADVMMDTDRRWPASVSILSGKWYIRIGHDPDDQTAIQKAIDLLNDPKFKKELNSDEIIWDRR
jgi:hypothetical protein